MAVENTVDPAQYAQAVASNYPPVTTKTATAPVSGLAISLGVIGPGNVGRTLLQQLKALTSTQREQRSNGLTLHLRAVMNSRAMVCAESLDSDAAVIALHNAQVCDLAGFTAHMQQSPQAIIIDCSGDNGIADYYADWLSAGIHVVTPSKHAGSGCARRYAAIGAATHQGGQFLYEASVGAGLPMIRTLRTLLETGDELLEINGILSGTLAWLFNHFDGSVPFSQLLRDAHNQGLTEPDPRDDLSGIDVARKLVILAREAGYDLSIENVAIENLVPDELRNVPLAEFMQRLEALDAPLLARLTQHKGQRLGYLARLDSNGAQVGLDVLDADIRCRATDNRVQYRTRRYADNPLVIQGPGAGPEVTAAGVLGDILQIAGHMGRQQTQRMTQQPGARA